ncbi:hypothetical protein DEIPH_ctg026orf0050 [Deinococcus phoenicis]|uniref:DUF7033 domain-containing protein n=1 Tax=Deinococcus phoenicis TaxID=1476583 RepID=A0A016QQ95_9DEIO|nr:polysaccharide deacetylase family protein [Deinococcus phoenicis]EYB68146.1 hypothetical protein DEIPH_ctg026orf0050 [Deinococcus phoenicis]
MPLIVTYPDTRLEARRYVAGVLLRDFLGLDFIERVQAGQDVTITCTEDSRCLRMPDELLATRHWLEPASLPRLPLARWRVPRGGPFPEPLHPELPVLYGRALGDGESLRLREDQVDLGLDVFGSSLFLLTRYEEVVRGERDAHGRFAHAGSLAAAEGLALRPLVNEYLDLLWGCLRHLWPGLRRRPRTRRLLLSHDVDHHLWNRDRHPRRALSALKADLRNWRTGPRPFGTLASVARAWRGDYAADPYNTFVWLMEQSERLGVRSAFYFITDRRHEGVNGSYALDDPWIRRLMADIAGRGHELGLHPSYHTVRDPAQIRHEFGRLRETAGTLGITQATWGGRQHYLRWEAPTTWQAWADAGLNYDSSVGFADHVGFRAGVCYEYRTFNLLTGQPLALTERPLLVMEGSLLDPKYMHLSYPEAGRTAQALMRTCAHFDGDFTLLWHNSHFTQVQDAWLYRQLLAAWQAVPA